MKYVVGDEDPVFFNVKEDQATFKYGRVKVTITDTGNEIRIRDGAVIDLDYTLIHVLSCLYQVGFLDTAEGIYQLKPIKEKK